MTVPPASFTAPVSPHWRRNQAVILLVTFVGFTGFTLVMPFLALYVRELGAADDGEVALWTGLALGSTPLVSALCGPFWGRIADRYGNKILVQRSLLSFVLVMAAMAYVTRPWHLFVLRVLQGFVAGYGSMTLSMAARSAPREQMGHAIGTVQTVQRIGPTIGPVIGGVLAAAVGLRNSFFIASAMYALALVVLTVGFREAPPDRAARPAATVGRVTFRNILAFENFLLLIGVIFAVNLVDRLFGPVLPLHLGQIGFAEPRIPLAAGVLFSILALAGAIGHALAAALLKRTSARAIIAWSAVGGAVSLLLFAFVTPLWLLMLAMAAIGVSLGTATTAAFAAAGAVIPVDVHAASFAFLTGASLVGSAVSPMVSGLVGGHSIRVVFLVGVVALGGLAVTVRHLMVEATVPPPPMPEPEP